MRGGQHVEQLPEEPVARVRVVCRRHEVQPYPRLRAVRDDAQRGVPRGGGGGGGGGGTVFEDVEVREVREVLERGAVAGREEGGRALVALRDVREVREAHGRLGGQLEPAEKGEGGGDVELSHPERFEGAQGDGLGDRAL